MKKYLTMAFAVLGLASTALADDAPSVSVITAAGDTAQTATLTTVEKVEFQGDSLLFITTAETATDTIKYARKDVGKLLLGIPTTSTTGIRAASDGAADKVAIKANGTELSVSGVKAGTLVTVYDMKGRIAARAKAQGESATINAASLNAGIYVVRTGDKAVKIVKK